MSNWDWFLSISSTHMHDCNFVYEYTKVYWDIKYICNDLGCFYFVNRLCLGYAEPNHKFVFCNNDDEKENSKQKTYA